MAQQGWYEVSSATANASCALFVVYDFVPHFNTLFCVAQLIYKNTNIYCTHKLRPIRVTIQQMTAEAVPVIHINWSSNSIDLLVTKSNGYVYTYTIRKHIFSGKHLCVVV